MVYFWVRGNAQNGTGVSRQGRGRGSGVSLRRQQGKGKMGANRMRGGTRGGKAAVPG